MARRLGEPLEATRALLIVLCLLAALARLVGIPGSPPGFYVDEAAISAHVVCYAQSGHNLHGEARPLFTEVLDGGGYLSPVHLYGAAGWVAAFGSSISSLRLFAAVCSLAFLGGIFLLARRVWGSVDAAWLATLSAAISPWVFQFARIAWDPGIALACLSWGLALLWGRRAWEAALAGLLLALAAYAYPPFRMLLAIALPLAAVLLVRRGHGWRPLVVAGAVAVVAAAPLMLATLDGSLQGRFSMLSVFNAHYLEATYGKADPGNALRAVTGNFASLLSPEYLLFTGDSNLRHSTGRFGIWSWLDALALLAAVAGLVAAVRNKSIGGRTSGAAIFLLAAYLAGLLPAALTWEGNPHALRSLGAVVFLSVGVGGTLAWAWVNHAATRAGILAVAGLFFLAFQYDYHFNYPKRAALWFDTIISKTAADLSSQGRVQDLEVVLQEHGVRYPAEALAYYHLHYGTMQCQRPTEGAPLAE